MMHPLLFLALPITCSPWYAARKSKRSPTPVIDTVTNRIQSLTCHEGFNCPAEFYVPVYMASLWCSLYHFIVPGRCYPKATVSTLLCSLVCQPAFMIYLELDCIASQGQRSLICHCSHHGHTQTFVFAASASLFAEERCPLLITIATAIWYLVVGGGRGGRLYVSFWVFLFSF